MNREPDSLPFLDSYRIPKSPHLHTGGPKMSATDLLALMGIRALALRKGIQDIANSSRFNNLSEVSDEQVEAVARHFGEEGLFKLHLLASTSEPQEFKHFFSFITDDLIFRAMREGVAERPLETDNSWLKAAAELDQFCHNVVNSSLSRKFYNPGARDGYVVYGLGGARILVSPPFRDAPKSGFDVFNNSLDVVTSLTVRGYWGTFLLLDPLVSLNQKFFGEPAWLLWFSIIASHSDLVLFVKEGDRDLSDSQKQEAAFTPDRVSKKVIELNPGELSWGKLEDIDPGTPIMNLIPGKGFVTQEEWDAEELRRTAGPHIQAYERGNFPRDRLIVLHEEGGLTEFPLDDFLGTVSGPLRHIPFELDVNASNAGIPLSEPARKRRRWWPFT